MHPDDLESFGLESGNGIRVTWDGEKTGAEGEVKADPECSRGAIYFHRRIIHGGLKREQELGPLLELRSNPVRVRITRVEV